MLTLYTEVDTKSAFSFLSVPTSIFLSIFFFNDTATTEIYTLSLHDALPICGAGPGCYNRPLLQRHYPHSVLGAGPKTHSDLVSGGFGGPDSSDRGCKERRGLWGCR